MSPVITGWMSHSPWLEAEARRSSPDPPPALLPLSCPYLRLAGRKEGWMETLPDSRVFA